LEDDAADDEAEDEEDEEEADVLVAVGLFVTLTAALAGGRLNNEPY
jgi:hypothetical protein